MEASVRIFTCRFGLTASTRWRIFAPYSAVNVDLIILPRVVTLPLTDVTPIDWADKNQRMVFTITISVK